MLQPTHMADFSHIQSLQTVVGPGCPGEGPGQASKAVLQLRVAGSVELLTVTCPSLAVAENMADLVDGYCRLVNNSSTSIWNRKGRHIRNKRINKIISMQINFEPQVLVQSLPYRGQNNRHALHRF